MDEVIRNGLNEVADHARVAIYQLRSEEVTIEDLRCVRAKFRNLSNALTIYINTVEEVSR
jgi:hypothetical protein